ncbi:hypothetical protein [Gimesia aquarii]|uniref:DUF4926 domain-containing protein n=1 Tax=Gimesia aquarii TaxID=2527964 RepID=A0A517W244_9PLAN|nr:hypothetical protein [Gimesia aquarii]QDT99310.1 hypothetical protein V144x_48210 [Gimesia aquarii]
MAIESHLLSVPIRSKYYVTLQAAAKGFDQYQGKVGIIRSVRADGFLEVDFSCSGGTESVHLDSYLMEEYAPPMDGGKESLNFHC